MKQKTIQVYRHIDNCHNEHCFHCEKCLKNKSYKVLDNNYCRICAKWLQQALAKYGNIYINKEIQGWINYLTDYFCLDHKPIVILKRRDEKRFAGSCLGRYHWSVSPIVIEIWMKKFY